MSFVEVFALVRGEAVSMDNWVPAFRGNIMFPPLNVGMSWQLQRHFAEKKKTLRWAAAKI